MFPTSLYIHIPWCLSKCPYCDFNSYVANIVPEERYISTLIHDLQNDLLQVPQRKLTSIFIGGGTPTLISANNIAKLLEQINSLIAFEDNIEITIEANPGTIEYKALKILKSIGINRLSIGGQSFQNDKLKILGRIHQQQDINKAVKAAVKSGFTNINLDLMYGLPEQGIGDALADLLSAVSLEINHLSWYQLTIEPNTPFFSQKLDLPEEDTIWEMSQQGRDFLADKGFVQYEVSAYSKDNWQCGHNLNYWQFGDYLGIGAGSHSKITVFPSVKRLKKHSHPNDYLDKEKGFIAEERTVPVQELIVEFMMNALRLYRPIPLKLFTERTSLPKNVLDNTLEKAQAKKFLKIADDNIVVTDLGKNFLNELLAIFI